jgi:hypothetical protein
MTLKLLFVPLLLIVLVSCKKEKDDIKYEIQGEILDLNSSSPIQGAQVKLQTREIASGTYNSSYATAGEFDTQSDGFYNFSVRYGGIESFKFTISNENYFSKEAIINPDDFKTDQINTLNFSLQSKGTVHLRIKNNFFFDAFDEISFNTINPTCTNCVKFNSVFTGEQVDTNLVGQVEANKYFKYQYSTVKNGFVSNFVDSVFCVIGDTTYKEILY